MAGEFELIRQYAPKGAAREDVVLGSGDDAALLQPPPGHQLVATVDTLIAGRHFPLQTAAFDIGWKALAVNLSDLAAMGAEAAWVTVALSLDRDAEQMEAWMADFCAGIDALAQDSGVAVVGGDLTAGPLSVTIQALGYLEPHTALRRDTAQAGDVVAVTGCLGDAALALQLLQAGTSVPQALLERLNRPSPRLREGRALAGKAHAAIDISDGLLADLGHILEASELGAVLYSERLPTSDAFNTHCPPQDVSRLQLSGGDDYELCVCLPADLAEAMSQSLTIIGELTAEAGLSVQTADGQKVRVEKGGYDHFAK
ncbi:MAG: thiamine-phosphate kinase [Nevskiales bacterium]